MPTIQVPLTPEAAARLRELARRELRPARLQAALILLDGLRRAGLDPDAPAAVAEPPKTEPATPDAEPEPASDERPEAER